MSTLVPVEDRRHPWRRSESQRRADRLARQLAAVTEERDAARCHVRALSEQVKRLKGRLASLAGLLAELQARGLIPAEVLP